MKELHKKVALGYLVIFTVIAAIVYTWYRQWQRLEVQEARHKEINLTRQELHGMYAHLVELSLLAETIMEWDEEDMDDYHMHRMAVDSMLCSYNDVYSPTLIDSVRLYLEDKEELFRDIMGILRQKEDMDVQMAEGGQQTGGEDAGQERRGLRGLFGGRRNKESATEKLTSLNRAVEEHNRMLSSYADSLVTRNTYLNKQLYILIDHMQKKMDMEFTERDETLNEMGMRFYIISGIMLGIVLLMLLVLYTIIHKDIREKEENIRAHDLLLEMNRKMILTISHDIRGPLNIINGNAELAKGIREKKKRDHYLDNIHVISRHVLNLLNNLLSVYRLNEAKESLNNVPFRLSELLNHIATSATPVINNKGLIFNNDFVNTDVVVLGDKDRLEQIIDNLLVNAIKFTNSGSISFNAEYACGTLKLEVSDTGIGMDKEMMDRIFIPFERSADSSKVEGHGLGLPITHGHVSLMGGSINVVSGVNKGSTFTVSIPLPLTDETAMKEDAKMPAALLQLPRSVLVIDDNAMQLELVRAMLERNGIACAACGNIQDLVNEMRRKEYDVLLTDIQMPGTDGYALLELMRNSNISNSKVIPIVAMTAKEESEKTMMLEKGFTDCIFKPFSMNELLECLSSVMKGGCAGIDFSPITSSVNDRSLILEKLIESSAKDSSDLKDALETVDRMRMRETVHRMKPMWEMLHMENCLMNYSELLKDAASDEAKVKTETEEMIARISVLISEAESELERICNEEKNTDSRG